MLLPARIAIGGPAYARDIHLFFAASPWISFFFEKRLKSFRAHDLGIFPDRSK
jgi:hypothetical protein